MDKPTAEYQNASVPTRGLPLPKSGETLRKEAAETNQAWSPVTRALSGYGAAFEPCDEKAQCAEEPKRLERAVDIIARRINQMRNSCQHLYQEAGRLELESFELERLLVALPLELPEPAERMLCKLIQRGL